MNWKTIGLGLLLADFSALSAWAIWEHGYLGIFAAAMTNAATMQLAADLVIALGIGGVWMSKDAREHGINPVPYLLICVAAGSFGPLLYLLRRERAEAPSPGRVRALPA
ncbi:MAG TPA: DUF2834 domain-containing protein [Candidatus Binatia bacterium]|nr:DUF2834 domain-containing protein [Candidatus Binatia bacterium]